MNVQNEAEPGFAAGVVRCPNSGFRHNVCVCGRKSVQSKICEAIRKVAFMGEHVREYILAFDTANEVVAIGVGRLSSGVPSPMRLQMEC